MPHTPTAFKESRADHRCSGHLPGMHLHSLLLHGLQKACILSHSLPF